MFEFLLNPCSQLSSVSEADKKDHFTTLPSDICLLVLKQLSARDLSSAFISCTTLHMHKVNVGLPNIHIAKAFYFVMLDLPTSPYFAEDKYFGMLHLPRIITTPHRQDLTRVDFSVLIKIKDADKSFLEVGMRIMDTKYYNVESIYFSEVNPNLYANLSMSLKAGLDEANIHYAKIK